MEHKKWNAINIGSLNSDNFFCVLWGRNGNRNAIANKHIPLPINGINAQHKKKWKSVAVYVQDCSMFQALTKHGQTVISRCFVVVPLHKLCDRLHRRSHILADNERRPHQTHRQLLVLLLHFSNANIIRKPFLYAFYLHSFASLLFLFCSLLLLVTLFNCAYKSSTLSLLVWYVFFAVDKCLVNWICRINLLF